MQMDDALNFTRLAGWLLAIIAMVSAPLVVIAWNMDVAPVSGDLRGTNAPFTQVQSVPLTGRNLVAVQEKLVMHAVTTFASRPASQV